ncbi:unnamed protein product [Symbiodinium sp. CCMP2592]|nr:unnamed protein product [Symbiodinium sp. CCMP2592]
MLHSTVRLLCVLACAALAALATEKCEGRCPDEPDLNALLTMKKQGFPWRSRRHFWGRNGYYSDYYSKAQATTTTMQAQDTSTTMEAPPGDQPITGCSFGIDADAPALVISAVGQISVTQSLFFILVQLTALTNITNLSTFSLAVSGNNSTGTGRIIRTVPLPSQSLEAGQPFFPVDDDGTQSIAFFSFWGFQADVELPDIQYNPIGEVEVIDAWFDLLEVRNSDGVTIDVWKGSGESRRECK